ncbi:hypothetical protein BO70DRAFT_188177 [Aspergillus heteromorphus CBS 117.55]|uniref:Uncharacterized protein n=1 Tax=Aspergillus heteromorphus CBS 117.55 TaxID=1448321 RepID=A0A317UW03_9EURO|nr:uncharacterized protein BO70DRAFT_188177 [Aspergillus heteromorphus CBS 117.55]PWY65208.1 hypothetical protein BO70DRAFT_188177 [Aspergillus heteromorphus CBS 117.55]
MENKNKETETYPTQNLKGKLPIHTRFYLPPSEPDHYIGQAQPQTQNQDRYQEYDPPRSTHNLEILHWLRTSTFDDASSSPSHDLSEQLPRVSPPARIVTPARYEQSRRAARLRQRREDKPERGHIWGSIQACWARMRRKD